MRSAVLLVAERVGRRHRWLGRRRSLKQKSMKEYVWVLCSQKQVRIKVLGSNASIFIIIAMIIIIIIIITNIIINGNITDKSSGRSNKTL